MDEPATGLREREVDDLTVIVRRLRDEHGVAVVVVSHDMRLINEACGRVVVFDDGAIMAEGPPDRVRDDPAVIAAYLGEVTHR